MIKKPKLLIIGHGRHGKDTFADLVVAKMDLSFISSSEFVGRVAIWEQWGKERYAAFSDMFEDRVNHRGLWFNFIVAYNTPNLARTGQEMMAAHDVYVGMRNPDEFHACMAEELFDHVIWVDASARLPLEPKESMGLNKDMADIWIDNNGPEEALTEAVNNLQNRLHAEGFTVNMPGDIEDLETDTEHFQLVVGDHPEPTYIDEDRDEPMVDRIARIEANRDPHDPPVQKPLEINSNRPTLKEYMGIINPPMVPNQGAIPPEVKCNGDCGCEDGSLCHQNVCGPISKMIVNPTLEESRKFHNDALMAQCSPPQVGTAALEERSKLSFRHTGGSAPAKPSTRVYFDDFPDGRVEPGSINDMAYQRQIAGQSLNWKDAPKGAIKVLDHGFFRVAAVMGSDQSIVDAARMSYGRGTKPTSSSASLINYLVRNYHTSPLEMCEIKFHIRMPIFVMRQWVRHRTANLNEYSGRYSEMVRLFYVPEKDQICHQNSVNKQGSAERLCDNSAEVVQRAMRGIADQCFDEYEDFLEMGVSRETARLILPLNTYTEVVWKLDISNLLKFLRLRDDSHAQWEIRQYAKLVSKAVEEHFPLVFAAYMETRESVSFTEKEIQALITGEYEDLSISQTDRIATLRALPE